MTNAVKSVIAEHLNRPGEVVECNHEMSERPAAQLYHFHSTLQVVILRKGWADGLVGEFAGRLNGNSLFVLGGNLPHKILGCSSDCLVTLLHIPAQLLNWDSEPFPELGTGMDFIRRSRTGLVYESESLVKKVWSLSKKVSSSEGFMRLSYLMQIIHLLCNAEPDRTILADIPKNHGGKRGETAIERAFHYIYMHYREEIRLDDVARCAGMDKAALCRLFKRRTGGTILKYVIRMRIEHACHLLLTTSLNISQIAWQCGFNSFSQFSSSFKRHTGMPPGEYRIHKIDA